MPLNDMESSIIQHDDTDCKQFGSAVGMGLSAPSSYDEVNLFSDGRLEQCAGLPEGEEILYINPCQLNCHPVEFSPMTRPKGRHV